MRISQNIVIIFLVITHAYNAKQWTLSKLCAWQVMNSEVFPPMQSVSKNLIADDTEAQLLAWQTNTCAVQVSNEHCLLFSEGASTSSTCDRRTLNAIITQV